MKSVSSYHNSLVEAILQTWKRCPAMIGDRLDKCKNNIEEKLLKLNHLEQQLHRLSALENEVMQRRPTKAQITFLNLTLTEMQNETGGTILHERYIS
jgi:hypothetical protein